MGGGGCVINIEGEGKRGDPNFLRGPGGGGGGRGKKRKIPQNTPQKKTKKKQKKKKRATFTYFVLFVGWTENANFRLHLNDPKNCTLP